MAEEIKQYAFHGKGFSGTTDDLDYANSVIKKNGNGAVYVRVIPKLLKEAVKIEVDFRPKDATKKPVGMV